MADTEYTADQIAEICGSLHWRLLSERDDARFGSGILRRYIENDVDMTKVQWDAILTHLRTLTTVTDPWAEKKHTGAFKAGPVDLEQDPKSGRWRMVHTLYRAAGYTVSAYLAEDGCQAKVYRYFYVDQATVPAHPATPAAGSGVGWQSNFQQARDTALFSGWWERKERLYQSVPTFLAGKDVFEQTQTARHLGVRAGDLDENGTAVTIPDPAASADGTAVEVDRSKNGDCTQDVNVQTKTAVNVKDAEKAGEQDAFETRTETEDANESAAGTIPANQTAGQITRVVSRKTRFKNRWMVRTITRVCKAVAEAVKAASYGVFETSAQVEARHQAAALTEPTVADGTAVEDQSQLDEYSKWTTRRRTDTAVNVKDAEKAGEQDAFEARTETEDANESEAGTIPADLTAGQITRVVSRKTRFKNRWMVRTIVRVCKAVAEAVKAASYGVFETSAQLEARHQDAALTEPEVADGTAVEDVSELDGYQKWTTRRRIDTAVNVKDAEKAGEQDAFEARTETEDANESAAGTIPETQTAGEIKQVVSRKTRFKNRWMVRTITRVCKAVAEAVKAASYGVFETSAQVEARHQAAALTAPTVADGTAVEDVSELDGYQKWTTRRRTDTAVNVKDAEKAGEQDAFEARTETEDANESAAGTIPETQTAGEIKQVVSRKTRFKNRWIVRTILRLAKAWEQPVYVTELDEFVKRTTERQGNQASVPDATAGQRVVGRMNGYTLFDWERTAEAPVTGLVGSTESYSLLGGTYSVDTYDEWTLATPIYPYGPDRPIKYYRYLSGVYRMQAKYVHTMKYHATRANALAEIDGAQEGSRVEKICVGCWMSVKITRDDVTLSTKSFPDPHGHLH